MTWRQGAAARAHHGVPRGALMLIGITAVVTYYFDPQRGRDRRAKLRGKGRKLARRSATALDALGRDVRNRLQGALAEARGRLRDEHVSDPVLVARVRAELGRIVSTPHAVCVDAHDGVVSLTGRVPPSEHADLIRTARAVRGVSRVEDRLEVRGDAPRARRRPGRLNMLQRNWAPATRLLAGVMGAALATTGRRFSSRVAPAVRAAGLALLTRAATNTELRRLVGIGVGDDAVTVQKTINIDAPIDEVFAFFTEYENFPRFMEHVHEVRRIDRRRSRWTVTGPGGVPVSWEAEVTAMVPNRVLAWKSITGAAIAHTGRIQFRPGPDRSTQVTVRMGYTPPAGALGHGLALLFGADPKQQMDEDLARLKSLLELGKTTAHGRTISARSLH